jgi:protein-arginine kinase activator protein McsA
VGDTPNLARIHREKYGDSLRDILNHFIEEEEYEYAAKVRDLIEENKKRNG